ncbi:aminodeoxychorismate synthase component I, partial [Flavobacteriaceae bacterium]|nr:aminodeoxychorismate synthase component I [Flavobacteriaceae bacterium]
MRVHKKIQLLEKHDIKDKLLKWSQQFREVVWLDSNNYQQIYSSYDAVLAVDAFTVLQTDSEGAFDKLKEYQSHSKDWLFGYLTYDLKFDTENLKSDNFDGLDFPELFFFQPKKIFLLKGNVLEVQ